MVLSENRMTLVGPLNMDAVPALFETGLQHLGGADLLVDLSQIEVVDSAAVSMLLAWQRAAINHHHTLQVVSLPANLVSLARLYGVEEMLPKQVISSE